ncbi:hypothetical protein [Paenibacillus sp. GCM10027626]|uniref:hypothetical protein n=1 Tax=Paenibacillus sp. GCM10027626 TaxID=3273411 RepID=UPI003634711D
MIKRILAVMLLVVLVGCNTGGTLKPNTLSVDDLCIYKDDDKKNKVCYGMSRSEAEKILGTGTKEAFGIRYDYGVKILYRVDNIAMIVLDKDSKNVYSTVRGNKIGNLKEDVLKTYGDKYPIIRETSPQSIDYIYDLENKKFLGEVSYEKIDSKKYKDHLYVSAGFNEDEYVNRIFLGDKEAIMYLR